MKEKPFSSEANAMEVVDLVKVNRDGVETRERLQRWLAEQLIGCIPGEEPNVARARIEPVVINKNAYYPVKDGGMTPKARENALAFAKFLENKLVA